MGKYEYVGAKIPQKMKEEIAELINSGTYLNESDFLRASVRKLINEENKEEK
jgi:Arc/MetJ-type ribon-helix-helix transcriptional regulator